MQVLSNISINFQHYEIWRGVVLNAFIIITRILPGNQLVRKLADISLMVAFIEDCSWILSYSSWYWYWYWRWHWCWRCRQRSALFKHGHDDYSTNLGPNLLVSSLQLKHWWFRVAQAHLPLWWSTFKGSDAWDALVQYNGLWLCSLICYSEVCFTIPMYM